MNSEEAVSYSVVLLIAFSDHFQKTEVLDIRLPEGC
jgi:hypothetical protein